MQERTIAVPTPGGTMETFVAQPAGSGPFPAVVMYMDMWGMRDVLRDLARRVASEGYYCALPDVYHRLGKVRYAETERPGPLSFEALDPERRVALRAAMDGLGDEQVMEDTAALLAWTALDEPVLGGAIGIVGFCMGGRHAFCAAGRFRDRIRATACLHGTDLIKPGSGSPHVIAQTGKGEIYCAHAERDKYAPADVAPRLAASFSASPAQYRQVVHRGSGHGYAIPDRDVYDARAAEDDWKEIFAMFRRQLPVAASVRA